MEYALYILISKLRGDTLSDHIPLRRHGIEHVETYDVTSDELERIERECADVGSDFQIAQFCLTIAISFFVALLTTTITSSRIFDTFVVIVCTGTILGLAFGVRWLRSRAILGGTIKKIKGRQIGPAGEEGREIKATDLAQLPSTEPDPSEASR